MNAITADAPAGCLDGGEGERTTTDKDRRLRVMDKTGDIKVTWDPNNKIEADFAKALFKEGRKNGMLGYTIHTDGAPSEVVVDLDANNPEGAAETVLSPALQGG